MSVVLVAAAIVVLLYLSDRLGGKYWAFAERFVKVFTAITLVYVVVVWMLVALLAMSRMVR